MVEGWTVLAFKLGTAAGAVRGTASGVGEGGEHWVGVVAATELACSRQLLSVAEWSGEAMMWREWLVGTIGESCDASLMAQAGLTKSMEPAQRTQRLSQMNNEGDTGK